MNQNNLLPVRHCSRIMPRADIPSGSSAMPPWRQNTTCQVPPADTVPATQLWLNEAPPGQVTGGRGKGFNKCPGKSQSDLSHAKSDIMPKATVAPKTLEPGRKTLLLFFFP